LGGRYQQGVLQASTAELKGEHIGMDIIPIELA